MKPILNPFLKHLRVADVELLLTAARLGNLGKAAALHHLSQSAASAAVLRVEAAFGLQLCHHARRQFELTDEGRLWTTRAEAWIRQLHQSVAPSGTPLLRLVLPHSLARLGVPAAWRVASPLQLELRRPDQACELVLRGEADVALVLDNAPWRGVQIEEICTGSFRLASRNPNAPVQPVLMPEEQPEGLALERLWLEARGSHLPIKARLPSWSLIADLCMTSDEVGFLPDFVRLGTCLEPVEWHPGPIPYRVLALVRRNLGRDPQWIEGLLSAWRTAFQEGLPTSG
ncbi:MAG: LysR family transcriptional regulator [Chlamydiia bacterium]